ncbi:hypothetical protein HOB10_00490 [Candidatus Parcubacteria bacterium]|nr:hypothetical protein [Candidatus Parcubacteria bacterium]
MTAEQVADAMVKMVTRDQGSKKWKPTELKKAIQGHFGVDKKICKQALRLCIDSERLIYTYYGSSYVEIPHTEPIAGD